MHLPRSRVSGARFDGVLNQHDAGHRSRQQYASGEAPGKPKAVHAVMMDLAH